MGRNIMIAVDASEYAREAFTWSIDNLYRAGDKLHLMHCVPKMPTEHMLGLPDGRIVFSRLAGGDTNQAETFEEQLQHSRVEALDRLFGSRLREGNIPFDIHVMLEPGSVFQGSIGELIAEEAQRLHAAAVVVASRSHGGLAEFLRGSVANHLTHHCSRPVAVLHPPDAAAPRTTTTSAAALASTSAAAPAAVSSSTDCFASDAGDTTTASSREGGGPAAPVGEQQRVGRNIVVAVGGGDDLEALRWAAQEMYRPGDTIHLVHVVPCLPPAWFQGFEMDPIAGAAISISSAPPVLASDIVDEMEREVARWKQSEARRYSMLMEELGVHYTFDIVADYTNASAVLSLLEADPVNAISRELCSMAEELDVAAVVLSSHPRSALMEFLLGSVSNQVAHHCSRPVVVLHARKPAAGRMSGSTLANGAGNYSSGSDSS